MRKFQSLRPCCDGEEGGRGGRGDNCDTEMKRRRSIMNVKLFAHELRKI
jgi:hypothetical protein